MIFETRFEQIVQWLNVALRVETENVIMLCTEELWKEDEDEKE